MKDLFFTLFLIVFSFEVFCQNENQTSKFYLYSHVGYIPDDDNHTSFHASAGYQFINWFGLGMSYGAFTEIDAEPESFSGLSLEYRLLAGKKWLARANFGFALNYNLPNHSEGELAPVDGSYPFFKLHIGYRINKYLIVGFGMFDLQEVTIRGQHIEYDLNGNIISLEPYYFETDMQAVQFTLGVNLIN